LQQKQTPLTIWFSTTRPSGATVGGRCLAMADPSAASRSRRYSSAHPVVRCRRRHISLETCRRSAGARRRMPNPRRSFSRGEWFYAPSGRVVQFPDHDAISGELTNRVTRRSAPLLAVWLVGIWALPLCCVSMGPTAVNQSSVRNAMQMSGHEHHHHHQMSANASPTDRQLAANDSCSQNCRLTAEPAIVATSLAPARGWITGDSRLADASPTLLVAVSGPRPIASASPPGISIVPRVLLTTLRV